MGLRHVLFYPTENSVPETSSAYNKFGFGLLCLSACFSQKFSQFQNVGLQILLIQYFGIVNITNSIFFLTVKFFFSLQ